MNKISFKARIYGLKNSDLTNEFENKTKNDNKHSIKIYNDFETNCDAFILYNEGKVTAKHLNTNIIKNGGNYKIEQLLKLYNILKIREAENVIIKRKKEKLEKDFLYDLKKMEEEELEAKKRKESIISLIEKADIITA